MDNIVNLDFLRIDRHKQRKCVCKKPKFTLDIQNRAVVCKCGLITDPFEAIVRLGEHYESINRQHNNLYEQHQRWLKEKPHSVIFKQLERSYQKGSMLPFCPECNQMFDFKDVKGFGNAQFYRKRAKQLTTDGQD